MIRKQIEIEESTLTKLKIISEQENTSVKVLMKKAIKFYAEYKIKERFKSLPSKEEKVDFGLLLLMLQIDQTDTVSENDVLKALK